MCAGVCVCVCLCVCVCVCSRQRREQGVANSASRSDGCIFELQDCLTRFHEPLSPPYTCNIGLKKCLAWSLDYHTCKHHHQYTNKAKYYLLLSVKPVLQPCFQCAILQVLLQLIAPEKLIHKHLNITNSASVPTLKPHWPGLAGANLAQW